MSGGSVPEDTESTRGASDPLEIARHRQADLIEAARVQVRIGTMPEAPERIGAYRDPGQTRRRGQGHRLPG